MARILWADDEITSLKPHIIFLENKEHEVLAVHSGNEAIEEFKKNSFDIVFLDENMPGMSGLVSTILNSSAIVAYSFFTPPIPPIPIWPILNLNAANSS